MLHARSDNCHPRRKPRSPSRLRRDRAEPTGIAGTLPAGTLSPCRAMDPVLLLLTGALPMMLIIATVLAFPVSWLLISLYRRAVLRAMNSRSGQPPAPPAQAARTGPARNQSAPQTIAKLTNTPPPMPPSIPLTIRYVDRSSQATDGRVLTSVLRGRWLTAAVYIIAGAAFALVMTYGWLLGAGEGRTWSKVLMLFWIYFWPTVLIVNMVAATHTRARIANIAAYVGVLCVLWAVFLRDHPEQGPLLWLVMMGPSTLMLGSFMARRWRGVGPLVLALLVFAWTGAFGTLALFQQLSEGGVYALVDFALRIGVSARTVLFGSALLGFAVFALLGWGILHWLARRYERYAMSDELMQVAAVVMLFAVVASVSLAFNGALWIFTGLAGFVAWWMCVRLGFAITRPLHPQHHADLLLLRVFALGARSERLFAGLQRVWLRQGSIAMIAGPDLASANIEPHEFLQFVRGRTREQFIDDARELDARTATGHDRVTPDGRYRVHEFFCFDDTWRPTLRRLVRDCDAVIMDLRAFSPERQGCVWELAQLFDSIALDRVVLVIDDTTDRPFLEQTLHRLWTTTADDSPNRQPVSNGGASPAVTIFSCRAAAERDLGPLLASLFAQPALAAAR